MTIGQFMKLCKVLESQGVLTKLGDNKNEL